MMQEVERSDRLDELIMEPRESWMPPLYDIASIPSTYNGPSKTRRRYEKSILSRIRNQLRKNGVIDITVIVDTTMFRAHRIILAAFSPYFDHLFTRPNDRIRYEMVHVEVNCSGFYRLYKYFYTGHLRMDKFHIGDIYLAAEFLGMDKIVKKCHKHLLNHLEPTNCFYVHECGVKLHLEDVVRNARAYVLNHFSEVIDAFAWEMLAFSDVNQILRLDDLNVHSEEVIVHAILTWIRYDRVKRSKYAAALLRTVRMQSLSLEFLQDLIVKEEVFSGKKSLKRIHEGVVFHRSKTQRSGEPLDQHSWPKDRISTIGRVVTVGSNEKKNGLLNVQAFSLLENSWKMLDVLDENCYDFRTAVVNNRIVIAGGTDGANVFNTVRVYNETTSTWNFLPPMKVPRRAFGLGMLLGDLYAIGGRNRRVLDVVECYNPDTKRWRKVSNTRWPRYNTGVATLNDRLFVIGGKQTTNLNIVEFYDVHEDTWIRSNDMLMDRNKVGACALNGCLYAVGGSDGCRDTDLVLDSVERFDPRIGQWTMVEPMRSARSDVGVCAVGDRLVAVGGYDGQQAVKNVEIYDPAMDRWESLAPLKFAQAGPCVVIKSLPPVLKEDFM